MRSSIQMMLGAVLGLLVLGVIGLTVAAQRGADLPVFREEHSDLNLQDVRAFSDFQLYFVGESFEGLPLTAITRRSDDPSRYPMQQVPGDMRANYVGFIYGDCEPVADTGCPLPLEIQVWPACERNLSSYSLTPDGRPLPHERLTVRGVPAAFFEEGLRLELYTGRVTVVIFGLDREQIQRAADALVAVNGEDVPGNGSLSAPAAGALEGELTCTAKEDRTMSN